MGPNEDEPEDDMEIRYEKDVYAAIARAIENRDICLVEDVMNQTRGWMEPEDVKQARNNMLEAVYELLCEVED